MRIALVTETFYPAVDGTTTTVKAVADRLIDTGHEVRIVAPGPGLTCYRRSEVVRLRPLDKPGGQVRDALASYRPDLVHVTSPGTVGRKALKHAGRLAGTDLARARQAVEATVEHAMSTLGEEAWARGMHPDIPEREILENPYQYTKWDAGSAQWKR